MIATMSREAFMEEVEGALTVAYGLRTDFGERALAGISEWAEIHAAASLMDRYAMNTWWSTSARCGCVVGEYLRQEHELDREDADAVIGSLVFEIEESRIDTPIRSFGISMDHRLHLRLSVDGVVGAGDADVVVILDGP